METVKRTCCYLGEDALWRFAGETAWRRIEDSDPSDAAAGREIEWGGTACCSPAAFDVYDPESSNPHESSYDACGAHLGAMLEDDDWSRWSIYLIDEDGESAAPMVVPSESSPSRPRPVASEPLWLVLLSAALVPAALAAAGCLMAWGAIVWWVR